MSVSIDTFYPVERTESPTIFSGSGHCAARVDSENINWAAFKGDRP